MKKRDPAYLRPILDAISRMIEIIGEATKRLSDEIPEKYPDISWKDMAGMRDKLIHDYFGVDMDAVWETVEGDIPLLKNKLKDLIRKTLYEMPKSALGKFNQG